MSDPTSIGLCVATGVCGYITSWFKERKQAKNQLAREKNIEYLSTQLEQLFWPMFFHISELLCTQNTKTDSDLIEWHNALHEIISTRMHLVANEQMVAVIMTYLAEYAEWFGRTERQLDHFPFVTLAELSKDLMRDIYELQSKYQHNLKEERIGLLATFGLGADKHVDSQRELIARVQGSRSSSGIEPRMNADMIFSTMRDRIDHETSKSFDEFPVPNHMPNTPESSISQMSPQKVFDADAHPLDTLQRMG